MQYRAIFKPALTSLRWPHSTVLRVVLICVACLPYELRLNGQQTLLVYACEEGLGTSHETAFWGKGLVVSLLGLAVVSGGLELKLKH